ncbi:unnamed protein product [Owenia fusiformis]|uniref:Uncharacterized protein n=1 Tax=Owenia fusiformis TaxID=6347 RepID=A0A8J1TL28_OWEFU|nr:unnamed protein product [Owenia fusiformis]
MLLLNLIAVCLVAYSNCDETTDELVAEFETALLALPESKWPNEFRQKLGTNYADNNDNRCCKGVTIGGALPPKTTATKKIVALYRREARKVKTGTTKCGWMSIDKCSVYSMEYFQVANYMYKEDLGLIPQVCGDIGTNPTCCANHIEILNRCLNLYWVIENMDVIQRELQKNEKKN